MNYALAYDTNAQKQLDALDTEDAKAVDAEAFRIADRPYRLNVDDIHYGFASFRHSEGDGYRIDYVILNEDGPLVLITGIKSVWLR